MAERAGEIITQARLQIARAVYRLALLVSGCTDGSWTLEIRGDDGEPQKVYRHHGPVSMAEAEELAV